MDPMQQPTQAPNAGATPPPVTPPQPPATPQSPQPVGPPNSDPGKTLGIVGLVLAFVIPIAGLIVSILAKIKSRRAGYSNGLALAGIIISAISLVIGLAFFVIAMMGANSAMKYCQENGQTVQNPDGSTSYNCEAGTSASDSYETTTQP